MMDTLNLAALVLIVAFLAAAPAYRCAAFALTPPWMRTPTSRQQAHGDALALAAVLAVTAAAVWMLR